MAIVRSDTFARANQTGWGTASDGNAWTIQSGNGQSISNNEGVIDGSSSSTFATLGAALAGADAEGLIRFTLNTGSTNPTAGIILRWTDSSNHWLCRYNGASGSFNLMVKIAGTYTSLTPTYALTPTNGSAYWLRYRAQGTTHEFRVWKDGTTEPTTWQVSVTNTNQNVAGRTGLYGFASGTGAGTWYDHFSVDDLAVNSVPLSGSLPSASSLSATLRRTTALAASLPTGGSLSGALTVASAALTASLPSGASVPAVASLRVTRSLTGSLPSSAALQGAVTLGGAGTGIGNITRSTGTQTANKSGNGYGTGDITGTEHDYAYTDATGSGWAIGANPWYGGMPASAWYQIDPGRNTTLPQKTSATGNLMSLLTTQSGGIVHWEEAGPNGFQSSELVTFANAGNFTELAPANTPFRAYVKAVGDAADANGISWTSWMCVYPGDPGLVVFRFDQHNGTGSAITVNESDIELIASLLTDTGANPTGIWNASNGFIGTIGGSVINGWPADSVHQAGTFDYCGITPDPSSGISLGTGAAVIADPSVQFGWAAGGYEAHISAASSTKPGRIKFGFYSDVVSNWTIPAGQTNTYYVLRVFHRNLTSATMAAIAADFKYPGTPTTTTGSFSSFSVDERAYVFAASANQLAATLDLSPAHVTVRYKPILKVTGWTASGAPSLTWGGALLTPGTHYRYTVDSANQTLYLQLYFDVVASGAQSGQRNNAALALSSGAVHLAATLPTGSGLPTRAGLAVPRHLSATLASASATHAALTKRVTLAASLPSGSALPARPPLSIKRALTSSVSSGAGATGALTITHPTIHLASTIPAGDAVTLAHPLAVHRPLARTIPSGAALSATLTIGSPTVHLAASVPSVSARPTTTGLRVKRPLHSTAPSGGAVTGALTTSSRFTGQVHSQQGLAAAGLVVTRHITATCRATNTGVSALLGVTRPLSGHLSPTSGVQGSLASRSSLSGAVSGSPALSAKLTRVTRLTALLPTAATLPASVLAVHRPLHGQLNAGAAVSGVVNLHLAYLLALTTSDTALVTLAQSDSGFGLLSLSELEGS